jgi:hypothetical protein
MVQAPNLRGFFVTFFLIYLAPFKLIANDDEEEE